MAHAVASTPPPPIPIAAPPVADAPVARPPALSSSADLALFAAAPVRLTWESFVPHSDPVLGRKMEADVAQRRARFQRIVKVALGACVLLCVLAGIMSAVSNEGSQSAGTAGNEISAGKTFVAASIEPLDAKPRSKARRFPAVASSIAGRRR